MVGGPPPTIHPRASDRTQVSRAALAVLPDRNFYRRYLRIVNRNLAIAHSDPLQGIAERDLPEPPPRPIRSCIAFPGSPCASAFPPARSVRPRPAFRPIEASRPRVGYVRNTSTPDMSLRETERGGAHALANTDVFLEMSRAYEVRGLRAFASDMRANWEEAVRQVEGRPDAEEQSVALITIHASKGLEWPIVIPINMTGAPKPESGLMHDRRSDRFSIPVFGVEQADYGDIKDWNVAELARERVRLIQPPLDAKFPGICRKFRVRAITMEKKETSYGETEATGYFRRAA